MVSLKVICQVWHTWVFSVSERRYSSCCMLGLDNTMASVDLVHCSELYFSFSFQLGRDRNLLVLITNVKRVTKSTFSFS